MTWTRAPRRGALRVALVALVSAGLRPPAAAAEPAGEAPAPRLAPAGEAELARGLPIVRIDVAGSRRVTPDDVRSYLRERVGGTFSPEDLAKDVRELWAAGYFEDIEVDLTRGDAGVALRFVVRERPNVATVEFEGNDEIDADDLKEAIELKENTVLSHPAIQRSVQKIRDLYAEKGYFLAEARGDVVAQKDNEVRVVFRVVEHQAVAVRRVTFIGNEAVGDDELRALMFTGQSGFLSLGVGGPFRQDAFERDIAVLNALYYDRGHLTVGIASPRVMLTPDRSGIEVSLTIDEGPRFKIRQLRVYERGPDGREVEPLEGRRHLRNMVRAESGDYFNRAELLEDLNAVRTLYRDAGFANVEATPETKLDQETNEVDVVVPVVRGPLVKFERIEISGNTKTRDKVIRREMEIEEGQNFSETLLERSKRRVTALGYFERVDVSTSEGSTPDRVRAIVEVAERPTGTFQVGAGFSSIESFIATAQVQQANLFGNGQNLSLNAQLSGIRQLVNVRYFEPYFLDSRFNFSVELYDQLRTFDDFSQASRGGNVTWGYPLIEPELQASVTYTAEWNDVSTASRSTFFGTASAVSLFTSLPLANLFNDGLTSSVRPALTYDSRDNRLFPTSGLYLRGSTELAAAGLGSDNEFLRHRFTGRYYYPLLPGVVLKANQEAGIVTSPSADGVPIFARFFLGGIFDVRGYRFRTIGPRMPLTGSTDPNGIPIPNGANIGGNLQFYQNVELEFPIVDSVGIRGVLFTDAGNAWNLEDVYCRTGGKSIAFAETNPCFDFPGDLLALRTSWGFGVRWFSPLGPLRFEWGFPFSPLPYEETSRFEFTIGNFF
ncbi:MAG: outer membrane protein assembly factor BamA [Deltaproteobacteria bacterium]|nr:outer membrane protein assembly factor BamA [Deltaproteobacteria bacterium]